MSSKSETEKDKISMRLELEDKLKERFIFLKNYYEQKSNVGLLRLLITLKYDCVKTKNENGNDNQL